MRLPAVGYQERTTTSSRNQGEAVRIDVLPKQYDAVMKECTTKQIRTVEEVEERQQQSAENKANAAKRQDDRNYGIRDLVRD